MTVHECALVLAGYCGVEDFDPTANETSTLQRGASSRLTADIATCLTASFQEAYDRGPAALSEKPMGGVLRVPTTVTLSPTQYSDEAEAVVTYASWMLGCTVRISGDDNDNRIVGTSTGAQYNAIAGDIGDAFVDAGDSLRFSHTLGATAVAVGSILVYDGDEYTVSAVVESTTLDPVTSDVFLVVTLTGGTLTLGNHGLTVYVQANYTDITLQRPFMGSTGTGVSATVYADSIPLPSNVRHLLGPVDLPGERRLIVASSAETFHGWNGSPPNSYLLDNRCTGVPEHAFVDTIYNSADATLANFLRVYPMPTEAFPVAFRAKLKPPTFTAADVVNASYDDPNVILPGAFIESTVLPIALKRWTAYPHVSIDAIQRDEIDRQYRQAIDALDEARPKVSRTRGVWAQG